MRRHQVLKPRCDNIVKLRGRYKECEDPPWWLGGYGVALSARSRDQIPPAEAKFRWGPILKKKKTTVYRAFGAR